jgi:hypothetical protein
MTPPSHRAEESARAPLSRVCGLALLAGLPASLATAAHADTTRVDPGVPAADGSARASDDPYGGQLDDADAVGLPGDESLFEVGLLGLGGVNALGLAAGVVADGVRGPTREQTRRALLARTDPGRPSGPGPRRVPTRSRPVPTPAPHRETSRGTGAHRRTRRALFA